MEKKLAITGITIKDGGMKGLDVYYSREVEKEGRVWNVDDTTERKIPVGEDLDKVIKAFRYYLLDIFGYNMEDVNVAECSIKEIMFDGNIVISGELRVLDGTRVVKIKTCKVDDSVEYSKMDELKGLVKQLKDEVNNYLDGKSMMSESQLVMQFYKKKGKFDEVEFAGMSDEDKKLEATKILEDFGSIVIHNEDMGGEVVSVPREDIVSLNGPVNFLDEAGILPEEEVCCDPNFEEKAESVVYVEDVKEEDIFVEEDEDGEEVFMIAAVKSI